MVIEAAGDVDVSVQASPLFTPLPAGETAFRRFDNLRYVYRYAPLADIFADDNPLSVSTAPPADTQFASDRLAGHVGNARRSVRRRSLACQPVDRKPGRRSIARSSAGRQCPAADFGRGRRGHVGDRRERLAASPAADGRTFPAGSVALRSSADAPRAGYAACSLPLRKWRRPSCTGNGISGHHPTTASRSTAVATQRRRRPACYTRDCGPPTRRPFNLFAPSDWRNQLRRLAARDDRLTAMQTRALEALGQPEQLTVGSWIASLGPLDVRVDRMRLAELGIQPLTTLPATQHPDNLRRGIDRLQQLHLSLLEVEGELTVTTESVLAELPTAVVCRAAGNVASLGGPAATAWQDADRESAFRPRLPASEWQASAVTWPDESVERAPYIAAGWHVHKISAPAAVQVTVFREPQLRVLSHVAWLG